LALGPRKDEQGNNEEKTNESIETEFFYFELSCFPTIVVIVAKPLSAIEKATAAMVTMHTMKKRHDGRNKRRRSDE
jgi:hypothetical protein